MELFIQFLFKFRFSIAVICLSLLCISTRIYYLDKYEDNVKAFEAYKTEQKDKQIKDLHLVIKTQEELQKAYTEQVEKLRNDFNKIDNISATNKQQLNGLYKVLSDNKTTYNQVSTDTSNAYRDTLSNLLGSCSTDLENLSNRADKATSTAVMYYDLAVKQKEIVDTYNKQIEDSK